MNHRCINHDQQPATHVCHGDPKDRIATGSYLCDECAERHREVGCMPEVIA
jgi:hypothetical protein